MRGQSRRLRGRVLRVLLEKEVRDLARDRKVLFAAILLPALLFPLLIAFSGRLFKHAEQRVTAESVRIGIVGRGPGLDRLVALTKQATWARGGSQRDVRNGELDAVVLVGKTVAGPRRYTVLHDTSRQSSQAAAKRLRASLATLVREQHDELLLGAGIDLSKLPARNLELVDVAADEAPVATIPRFLPMLIVLVLLSASAFAAIDLFPGERERGTLETLLVQPMRASEVLAAKYGAVWLVGIVAIVANVLGMLLASGISGRGGPGLSAFAGILLLAMPLSFFLAAFLVRVVARARTVREAQNYLLPMTLLCLLPAFMAGSPDVPFDGFTACLPLAGPSLAFREVMLGQFAPLPLTLMTLSTIAYSVVVLAGALKHLSNEEHLLIYHRSGQRVAPSRSVILVLCSILGLFALGPFFQGESPLVRLGAPLVLFTAMPVLLFGGWAGMPVRELLAFRPPTWKHCVTAVCAGLGLALLATSLGTLQTHLLPLPQAFQKAASGVLGTEPIPLPVLLLLLAVLPALVEELLYRRFLLTALLRNMDTGKALLATALLFALHHLSIFRFLPTLAAGLVLAWLVLTTHSFWTAPIAHALSNAIVVLVGIETSPLHGTAIATFVHGDQWALIRIPLALVLIFLPRRLLDRREQWEPRAAT